MKQKVLYCDKCRQDTKHLYVGTKESTGYKAFTAIATFGLSAAFGFFNKYWECSRCGTLKRG